MLVRVQRGVSLIELMIGLVILGLLLFLALPNFSIFLQNTQIRNAGESVLQGLNLARAEALRRNSSVRFQLVSNLSSSCALSDEALSWVVSTADPTGKCDETPGATATGIVQKQSSRDGTPNVEVEADGTSVVFNGMGRVVGTGIGSIDLRSLSGACEHEDASGTMRCLRVLVSGGGQIRLCDPKVDTGGTDPRRCPPP